MRARAAHSHALDKGRKTGKVVQIGPLLEDFMDWPADLQGAFHAQDAPVMGRGKFAPRQHGARSDERSSRQTGRKSAPKIGTVSHKSPSPASHKRPSVGTRQWKGGLPRPTACNCAVKTAIRSSYVVRHLHWRFRLALSPLVWAILSAEVAGFRHVALLPRAL